MFHLLIEVVNLQVLGLLQQPGQNTSVLLAVFSRKHGCRFCRSELLLKKP